MKQSKGLSGYLKPEHNPLLTHLCLESHKSGMIGKQCRPRSDAAERGVWSESTLFASDTELSLKDGYNKT